MTPKPEKCLHGMGPNGGRHGKGRCDEWAATGSTLCVKHRALELEKIKAAANPRRAAYRTQRWGAYYSEVR